LRIIHLEDDSKLAVLVASTPKAKSVDADIIVASTRSAFRAVVSQGVLGVVLSVYNLSAFDGLPEKTSHCCQQIELSGLVAHKLSGQ